MNQILVNEKVYITPNFKKKKKLYKFEFVMSIFVVLSLFSYYIYAEYDRNMKEVVSKEILEMVYFNDDKTTTGEETLIVSLNGIAIEDENVEVSEISDMQTTKTVNTNGKEYNVDSILTIPTLGINYPVLSETSEEMLKVSLTKFWGNGANEIGNYCIAGHNYRSGKMFGKLSQIVNGDIVELQDITGRVVKYAVYNSLIVEPEDVSCTGQKTNGKREITLITCCNNGNQRFIVKCREI